MIKAILFDLDGTLLDTIWDIHASVNEMLRAYSYPEIGIESTRAFVGDGAKKLIERALPKGAENVEACYEYFKEHFERSDNSRTRLFDGEAETLSALKARGLKLGVVTNKPHAATVRLIGQFFGNDTFDFVAGDSGMFPCKPDPTLALYAALSMRVSVGECLFAGDGETDVQVALSSGMQGVACLWGYRSREQLTRAGATVFLKSFPEFLQIVEKFS